MAAKKSNKQLLVDWDEFKINVFKATPVDLNESPTDKIKRITKLEANPEQWFKYYFPNFYTSEPAPFHIRSTKKILSNLEYFLVRSWSRELSKSGRTMMEDLYLAMTGKKKNFLEVSSSYDNAVRLLQPYKIILESNNRLINDYGEQQSINNWEAGEFVTKSGVSFRAIGAGQSPRGTRRDEKRPDKINIDDIDTDEECRNPERIKAKLKWIMEALIPTRSISEPLQIVVNGNIIAKYCCVTELAKLADSHEIVNIRDKDGKSTWPQKNSEENIDRVLKTISYNSAQKEYFNNPVVEGTVIKDVHYGKCPPLKFCEDVLIYADPSTSNKDRGSGSTKSVVVLGRYKHQYFVYKVWVDQMSNARFVECLYEAYRLLVSNNVDIKRVFVENNSLQDPHYEQVLMPLILEVGKRSGFIIPITPDSRKKPDKFHRIEGTLEPLNRLGNLIFKVSEKDDPNMKRCHDQMLGISEKSKMMDAPDSIEGGIWIMQQRVLLRDNNYVAGLRSNRKY
ncbi:MAG: hypothetical protein JST78_09605 [Bacteroidetes bacterium]|nr:hypothetical protein [Bacteroidota bacterium]